jgi:hypothetical protein
MFETANPAAADLIDQPEAFQDIDGLHDVALAGFDDRVAAGFLVAAGHERIDRERIGVGHGALFFDEGA